MKAAVWLMGVGGLARGGVAADGGHGGFGVRVEPSLPAGRGANGHRAAGCVALLSASPDEEGEMRKISWLLAAVGGAALVSAATVQGVAAQGATGAAIPGPATVLKFSTMTPVTGPYVGPANPVRGEAGGGLPWVLTAGSGFLQRDGRLLVRVRGLVLARQAPVPPALQGTNPFPDFRALVSCQSIGAGNTATVTNISTGDFKADTAGNSTINATVSLPRPCIAPIVFVTGPTGTDVWFAVTGS